jgi:hypothetical protein
MADYHRAEIAQPELKELADAVKDRPIDRYAHDVEDRDLDGQRRYMEGYRAAAAQDPIQIGWDKNEPEFHAKTESSGASPRFETELGQAEDGKPSTGSGGARVRRWASRWPTRCGAAGKPSPQSFDVFWSYFQWSPKFDTDAIATRRATS